jgi:polyisoprenoid-binding protein YceI
MLRKTLVAILTAMLLPAVAAAEIEKYNVDPAHTEVGFTIRHFVSKVPGRFNQFAGEIQVDPQDPSTMVVQGTVQTTSIDTNQPRRDEHLRSADFFDVATYPAITFTSKKVTKNAAGTYTVLGDLTMHGVTKEVPLEVEVLGFGPDGWGGIRAGLEAKGKINRKDFGMTWNKVLDTGGTMLSEDVDVVLHVEAVKAKPEPEEAAEGGAKKPQQAKR